MWFKKIGLFKKFFQGTAKNSAQPDVEDEDSNIPDYVVVTNVLDLHGLFPEQVQEMLEAFLQNAVDQGYRECRIIHGKGKSKLKWITRKILDASPLVARYYDAPPELGSWGATIVEMKYSKRSSL